jgi:hypothetical protein
MLPFRLAICSSTKLFFWTNWTDSAASKGSFFRAMEQALSYVLLEHGRVAGIPEVLRLSLAQSFLSPSEEYDSGGEKEDEEVLNR